MTPTETEFQVRDSVLGAVLEAVRADVRIPMSLEPSSPYKGEIQGFRYLFEGEDDLLHLLVERVDGSEITPEQAQEVVELILPDFPSGLMWLKPGVYSQHFYFGHDELLNLYS